MKSGTNRTVLFVPIDPGIIHVAVASHTRRVVNTDAGGAQPPPVAFAGTVHIATDFAAVCYIGGIGRNTAGIIGKVAAIACFCNRQKKDFIGSVVAAICVMIRVIIIDNSCFRNSLLLFLRKCGADKIIACIILTAVATVVFRRAVPIEPGAHGASFPCNLFPIRMILKYVKVLIGEQEQLPACIFQHPPFDGVYIIAAVYVAALLIGAEINVVRLPAADVCGSSAVCKLDCLACICSCRKCRRGQQPQAQGQDAE